MKNLWQLVNLELVGKAIGELTYEQVLAPVRKGDHWELHLGTGATYEFRGWMTVWDHLRVCPESIKKTDGTSVSAANFFLDSQAETGMDAIVLANFLEEMNSTLKCDLTLHERNKRTSILDLANWDGEELQSVLNGHPKILLNKGRLGFGSEALQSFAPETSHGFQLHWIAVHHGLFEGVIPGPELLDESFDESAKEVFIERAKAVISKLSDYAFLPVHPWQWDRIISLQFVGQIAEGKIVSLGLAGDFYRPQVSLRTLSNMTREKKNDIKLPLSILNTSCIRGLSSKTVATGVSVSQILHTICHNDEQLSLVTVLKETGGASVNHPDYVNIKGAPYRYLESLGAIWRESTKSHLASDEKAILTSALFHQDSEGRPLIEAYVRASGLSLSAWLKRYFEVVMIPLYHLQLSYGVGIVAHGQNIVLRLKKFTPVGIFIKDFQGDLRLSRDLPAKGKKYFQVLANELTALAPEHLLHDLITGHIITVLRFLSGVLEETNLIKETEFYSILAQVLSSYERTNDVTRELSLLTPSIDRLLLNKVRFAIGYADSAARPLPQIGSRLKNPLFSQEVTI